VIGTSSSPNGVKRAGIDLNDMPDQSITLAGISQSEPIKAIFKTSVHAIMRLIGVLSFPTCPEFPMFFWSAFFPAGSRPSRPVLKL
jgi:hypothetical protein